MTSSVSSSDGKAKRRGRPKETLIKKEQSRRNTSADVQMHYGEAAAEAAGPRQTSDRMEGGAQDRTPRRA